MSEKKSISTLLWVLFILIFVGVGIYLLYPVKKELRAKQEELQKQEAELHALKKRQTQQQQQNHDLRTSPAAVEKVAREEYRMVRKNETVIYLPKDAKRKWDDKRSQEQK